MRLSILLRPGFLTVAAVLLFAPAALAQPTFSEVSPPSDTLFVTPAETDFWVNAVAPADLDGDGDLDLAVLGFYVVYNISAEDMLIPSVYDEDTFSFSTHLLRNDGPDGSGSWLFSEMAAGLDPTVHAQSAWADDDGDDDLDLFLRLKIRTALCLTRRPLAAVESRWRNGNGCLKRMKPGYRRRMG